MEDLTEYEELNPRTMEFDRLVELMHPKFLTEYLNRIYSFLKGDNKEMCFPNIAPYKEIFLVRLASNTQNLKSSVFNKECKDISDNIIKLLTMNKDVYQWKYFYEDGLITKNILTYRKVYKYSANYHQIVDKAKSTVTMDPEPDCSDTASDISDNGQILTKKQKRQKVQLMLQKCVNNLQQSFIHNTIQALQDFIKDEFSASLEFPNLTAFELKFLRHVSNMTSRKFYRYLTSDVKYKLKNFNEYLNNCHKKFRLRMDPGTVERSVIIKKVPRYEPVSSHGQNNTNKAISIRFQSAGYENTNADSQTREQTSDHEERTQSKDRIVGLNERKSKLMQAMSTPLESDRALRMMKLMGWEGGALGTRGDGIVEPIMPALEIVTGRGLGHTSSTQQSKTHTPEEFRVGILEKILELFQSTENVKEIEFHRKLNRKERNFVSTSVKALNNRRNIGLNSERERELVNTLTEKLLNAPDLRLESEITISRKKVTITKSNHTTTDLRQKLKTSRIERTLAKLQIENGRTSLSETANKDTDITNGRKSGSVAMEETEKKNSIPYKIITTKDINSIKADKKASLMLMSCKSVKTIAYKLVCMTALLDFVKSEALEQEIRFDLFLNTKQCRYVNHILEHVNTRLAKGVGSKIEVDMVKQMIDCSRGCFLSVEFNKTCNHFILRKSYYKKRFVNSAQNAHVSPSNGNTTQVNNTNNSTTNNVNTSVATEDNKNEKSSNIDSKATNETDCNNSLSKELDLSENIVNDTSSKISTETDMKELDNDIKHLESLIMNADCDIFDDNNESNMKIENGLESEENTSNLSPNTKRSWTTSDDSDEQTAKKIKFDLEKYCIVPNNYPEEKITIATIKKIQLKISDSINVTSEFLPLLSCHGVQKGGLIYSCHNEKTMKWLELIVRDANLKMIKFNNTCEPKIIMKINSYIKIDIESLFEKIELYNEEVATGNWIVLEEYVYNEFIVYVLQVDRDSLDYIKEKEFSLFIGVDKATFSIVTD